MHPAQFNVEKAQLLAKDLSSNPCPEVVAGGSDPFSDKSNVHYMLYGCVEGIA